jgi:hypothetical protein
MPADYGRHFFSERLTCTCLSFSLQPKFQRREGKMTEWLGSGSYEKYVLTVISNTRM